MVVDNLRITIKQFGCQRVNRIFFGAFLGSYCSEIPAFKNRVSFAKNIFNTRIALKVVPKCN